jgi:hypothetical protein
MCVLRDYSGDGPTEGIACDLRVNSSSQSTTTRALSRQFQAPEARVAFPADHHVVMDGDALRLGGIAQVRKQPALRASV